MESFHWNSQFETGIEDVDLQHHKLVDLTNHFSSLLTENELIFEDIETVLSDLGTYSETHFSDEERLMKDTGIDKHHFNRHIAAHYSFLEEVKNMASGLTEKKTDAVKNLLHFLTNWLAYHILGMDQNMARQIKSIRAGLTPEEAYKKEEKEADEATGPLLNALDNLFEQVSLRNKELVLLNETLEARVEERTKELHLANKHLETLSLTDVLTGLPNRRHALQTLTVLWEEAERKNSPLALMMIDADYFKEVNDTHGHDAGDEVLCRLSTTLQHSLRNDDIVCRLGGDEFLVLCPNTDKVGATHIAEKMRKKVAELRVPTGDGTWNGSISVGVAAKTDSAKNYEELIKIADKGVYAAKKDGKNCVRTIQ